MNNHLIGFLMELNQVNYEKSLGFVSQQSIAIINIII